MRAAYETLQQKKEKLQTELISTQRRCAELQAVNENLKSERSEILSEIQTCKRRNAQCGVDLDETEKQYGILKAKFEEANRRAQQSHNETVARQRKIEELQYKLDASTRDSILHDSFMEKLKQERRILEEELKASEADNEKLLADLRTAQHENDNNREEYNLLQQRLHDTDGQLHKIRIERDRVMRDFSNMESSAKELRDVSHRLQSEKDDRERELYMLQKKLVSVEKDNDRLNRDNHDKAREIDLCRGNANKQESIIQTLKRKETELKAQLDEAFKNREDLTRIKTLLSELQRRLEVAMQDLEQKDSLIAQLKNDKDYIRRDCEKFERDNESCKSSLDSATREKERLSKELMGSSRKIADYEISVRQLYDENIQIKKLLNSYESKMPVMEQALQKHQHNESRFAQEANTAKTSMVRLEKEILFTSEERNTLHMHIKEYEEKHGQLNIELEEAYKKIFELEAMNEMARRTNTDMKRDCDNRIRKLEETLQTADRANTDLKNQMTEIRKRYKNTVEETTLVKREHEELQNKWNYANSDGTGKDRIIDQLKQDLNDSHLEIERLRQEHESRVTLLERTTEEKQELSSDVEHLKQRVYELERLYKVNEEEKEKLQQEVTEMNRLISQQQTDTEGVQRDSDIEIRQLKSHIAKLESRVEIIMSDCDHVSNQLEAERLLSQKYKEEFERVQREYLEHQKICERYADQILDRDRTIDELNNVVYRMQSEIDNMQEQLRKAQTAQQVAEQQKEKGRWRTTT